MSAINGVGGAYSEHVPVICIAGSIPLRSIDRGLGMHHTMADGSWDHFLAAYAHVTAASVRLTPRNAATEIDRLILTAWREKLPVYMEVPSDIAYLEIEVPSSPLVLAHAASDAERLRSCIGAIAERLAAAQSPAILVDADADRFGVAPELMALADKIQAPIAVIIAAKAVIDETFAHYVGVYNGKASEPRARDAIQTSDCLLAIGYRPIEVTTGHFSASLPANTIHARGHSVDVGGDNYQAVTLKEVLAGVLDAVPRVTNGGPRRAAAAVAAAPAHGDGSATLTQAAYWQAMQGYLREGDVLFVDNGTAFTLFGLRLPSKCTLVGSVNWGSIGYSGRRAARRAHRRARTPSYSVRRRRLVPGRGTGAVDDSATRSQAGRPAGQQRRLHDRTWLSGQGRRVQRRGDVGVCRPAESIPPRHLGAIVRGQDRRRPATRPQYTERLDDLRRIDHGRVRRARAHHHQQ